MKKLKTIVDRIKEKNIKQRPKWYFTTLNTLIWICYIICILIGAASFSIILFSIHQTDFNLISHMSHSRLEMFLGILPFFWIIILLIFLFASIIIFRKSKSGYKFNWFRLLTFSAAVSVLLGVDRTKAARFSFLMVVPLIFGKIGKDVLSGGISIQSNDFLPLVVGFIAAFISGLFACKWMIALVKKSQLSYFSIYCFVVGIIAIVVSVI